MSKIHSERQVVSPSAAAQHASLFSDELSDPAMASLEQELIMPSSHVLTMEVAVQSAIRTLIHSSVHAVAYASHFDFIFVIILSENILDLYPRHESC